MKYDSLVYRVASRFLYAGPLTDVSKLRFQAVFLIGAGGSGKGSVGMRWLKYMPGAGPQGVSYQNRNDPVTKALLKRKLTDEERNLKNLSFENALEAIKELGIKIELLDASHGSIPFRLHTYDGNGKPILIDPKNWATELPPEVYEKVKGLTKAVFTSPVHELPSYWRHVDPDLYKKELAGYLDEQPGFVHEMSSEMSKSYFLAAVETGDPILIDGTGAYAKKVTDQMELCKKYGYRISLIYVIVPLTVNHIRNALRDRNVDPNIVTNQWFAIQKSYEECKTVADKARVIINRDDARDIGAYKENKAKVDNFIQKTTGYSCLYDYIAKVAPGEISEWGRYLK